jgi:hypothetical protein
VYPRLPEEIQTQQLRETFFSSHFGAGKLRSWRKTAARRLESSDDVQELLIGRASDGVFSDRCE